MKFSLRQQRGLTLLEAVIAIVVSALGILGVLGMQMRTLADSSTNVRRAQAIRLIEDLGERLAVNHNAWRNLDRYQADWGPVPSWMVIKDCASEPCQHYELAEWDMAQWKNSVATWLPGGDARVFIADDEMSSSGNRRQLGVMIAWRENEPFTGEDKRSNPAGHRQYMDPINAAKGAGQRAENQCPEAGGKICHLQFIAVPGRCLPEGPRNPHKLHCADLEH